MREGKKLGQGNTVRKQWRQNLILKVLDMDGRREIIGSLSSLSI